MTNTLKRQTYLHPFAHIFTRDAEDVYDSIAFRSSDCFGDEASPALASPVTWSDEAVSVIAAAAHGAVPADLRSNEENTVPSWLWRHQSRSLRREAEYDLRDIFNRAVGSAAAKAWKLGLFTNEKHARNFYDEARYALMQRHIAILPEVIAPWGLSWAYGIEEKPKAREASGTLPHIQISNATIDALLRKKGKNAPSDASWKKMFAPREKEKSAVSLRLCDIAADWHSESNPARAAIDLMVMRHNDGSVNIDALCHAARLLTVLLDLQERNDVTIGFVNLAPLLMALGLAYDSDAGRAMAASIAALITAECTAASAEMAALRGMSETFTAAREAVMRALRNHRRAAYGDGNDYEKLSVLPAPLPLKNCPDLLLVAEAQRRWDDALKTAQNFGLRAIRQTDLTPSPVMGVLMGCSSQGLGPLSLLTVMQPEENDMPKTVLHPAVHEALTRLGYAESVHEAALKHIAGTFSLRKAPRVNFASLKARGLSDTALEKIEAYLPCVNSLRLAVTPWIIGVDYCRNELKIPARKLESPHFDLLRHLGFSDDDLAEANRHCFGCGTAHNAKFIALRHRSLFARNAEISIDAQIRMAAATQSFISGDTGMEVSLPASCKAESGAEVALQAWRLGLKSLDIVFDPGIAAKPRLAKTGSVKARRIRAKPFSPAKPKALPRGRSMKAPDRKVSLAIAAKKQPHRRSARG